MDPRSAPPSPMLARLAGELPLGDYSYEPKWDGFRCLAVVRGGEVDLHSRHGRALTRYFPEVAAALAGLGVDAVLDGELVVARGGALDFGALLCRLHPSPSRVERLRRETPAAFVAFDLLAAAGEPLASAPFLARRRRLEALLRRAPPTVKVTPSTRDVSAAAAWLDRPPGQGIDGVVAKHDALTYQPGRRAMIKVKRLRTAECVVGGLRTFGGQPVVASLLLGAWDGERLVHVGVSSSFPEATRRALFADLAPRAVPLAGHPWERGFNVERSPVGRLAGSAGRWDPATMGLDWTPLAPSLVCEVAYDQLDGARFRHPARLLRWRPDREARSCLLAQLAQAPGPERAAS